MQTQTIPAASDDRVRSLPEVAALMGISVKTLRRMIDRGEGPTVTRPSPGRIGIRDSHRLAYLDAHQQHGAQP